MRKFFTPPMIMFFIMAGLMSVCIAINGKNPNAENVFAFWAILSFFGWIWSLICSVEN